MKWPLHMQITRFLQFSVVLQRSGTDKMVMRAMVEALHHCHSTNATNMHQTAGIAMETGLASTQIMRNRPKCWFLTVGLMVFKQGHIHWKAPNEGFRTISKSPLSAKNCMWSGSSRSVCFLSKWVWHHPVPENHDITDRSYQHDITFIFSLHDVIIKFGKVWHGRDKQIQTYTKCDRSVTGAQLHSSARQS